MKKLVVMLAAVIMALSLASCGGGSNNAASTTDSNSSSSSSSSASTSTESTSSQSTDSTSEEADESGDTEGTENTEQVADPSALEQKLNPNACYMGTGDNEGCYYYLGFSQDQTWGALIVLNSETKEYASWVGAIEIDNENNTISITDEVNQTKLTFGVDQQSDSVYTLDLGETLGGATVERCNVSDLVEAINNINAGGTPIA